MITDTSHLERCIASLDKALILLSSTEPESIDYEMYRSACVKEFEIIKLQNIT